MKKTLLLTIILFQGLLATAQFGTAPDFTVTDIEGVEHNLYDMLDSGKIVILDVSATWCGPCWSLHQSHALSDVHDKYGPEGTDVVRVMFYEGDADTGEDALNGTGGSTLGNWVEGIEFPIINESPLTLNLNIYAPLGFPTVNVIRPRDREIVADMWNFNFAQMENSLDDLIASEGITSNEEVLLAQGVNIFPNPTAEYITVNSDLDVEKYEIVNVAGQIVQTVNKNIQKINVSGLDVGQYFLRIRTTDKLTVNKAFTKQ